MSDDEKKRLTLYVDGKVSDEAKKQAREMGMSVSAYFTMLIMLQKKGKE